MTDHNDRAIYIAQLLKRTPMRTSSEKVMQEDIERALQRAGVDHKREFSLNAADRPDFFSDGIVIEAKVRCAKRVIYRQLDRYAKHDRVTAVILVSCTAMGLPEEIQGKPAYFVSPGLANL